MKQFPKLSHLTDPDVEVFVHDSDEIYVLEKVDGANFRWKQFDNNQLLFGSRRVVFKDGDEPQAYDETNKQFRHVIDYLQETVDLETLTEITTEYGNLVFYGEAMHKHTIDYEAWDGKSPDIKAKMPNYIGFDIWNEDTGEWVSHSEVIDIHSRLGLETVPVLQKTTVTELNDEDIEIPQSEYRTPNPEAEDTFNQEGLAEGLVLKNDSQGVRAKKVAEYMQEVNQFGAPDDDESLEEMKSRKRNARKLVSTFVTEQRVLKNAHKLVDEGKYDELEMPMMKDLPQRVLTDVFAEEGWAIINHEYEIEFTEDSKESIRQVVSDKCARLLKEEITTP